MSSEFDVINKAKTQFDLIKQRQFEDPLLIQYRDVALNKAKTQFEISPEGVLLYDGRFCVPDVAGLRRQIMGEAHYARYSVHPGSTKMYRDLRCLYWWDDMKKDIAEFVRQCPNCQQVKIGPVFSYNWKSINNYDSGVRRT